VIRIYADYNATTRPAPEVCALMAEVMQQGFGNPSSIHGAGQEARRLVERARAQVAGLVNAEPDEIVFTSGGTEADNLAVLGAMAGAPAGRRALVTSTIEHHAILEPCEHWRRQGGVVTYAAVDADGRLDLAALTTVAGADVALVSVMLANNDTGVIQEVEQVAKTAAACGALTHTDAVQAAGKMAIDVKRLGVSLLSLSSHKLHGPKGAGALFVGRGVRIAPLVHGGRQERGLRPGTENVPAIVGFGKACELAAARLDADSRRVRALRDRFETQVLAQVEGARINGCRADDLRLPNTSNIAFPGLDGEALTSNLDMLGMAVSTGAACSIADHKPSHVLLAMGQSEAEARSSVRFSFGRETTEAEISTAVELVSQAVALLRGARP
jgi:cysteine desulfurase